MYYVLLDYSLMTYLKCLKLAVEFGIIRDQVWSFGFTEVLRTVQPSLEN